MSVYKINIIDASTTSSHVHERDNIDQAPSM